jgi:hypothetical protein
MKDAKKGEQFTVLGVQRVSLALVSWRFANANAKPWVLDWHIAYATVSLAVFG